MSGGSLNYLYRLVQEGAETIRLFEPPNPLYHEFADHLKKVAQALHDIEWVQSCDYSLGG